MKAIAPPLATTDTLVEKGAFAVFSELVKARLTFLVLITTAVGYYLGSSSAVDAWRFLIVLAGTGSLAAGAAALNQLLERSHDVKMDRTKDRPLPSGRMTPGAVLLTGAALSMAGLVTLTWFVNALTGFLGLITFVTYLFIYTPLKRLTTLNTLVGAIPGALPPLMGWTAATGEISRGGWALFTILFFWQLPHFMAIAWLYREQYARAGFRMLPMVDPDGTRTAGTAMRHTLALTAFSLAPYALGIAGRWYVVGALILGFIFLSCAVRFSLQRDRQNARSLFFASIIHLPLLLGLLVLDKIRT